MCVNSERAKQWLQQAQKIDRRIALLTEQSKRTDAQLKSCTQNMGGERTQGGSYDWTDGVIKLMELKEHIDAEIARLAALKQEAITAITALPDADTQHILIRRYIDGWEWPLVLSEVLRKLEHSEDWMWSAHRKALKEIKVPENFSLSK